MRMLHFLVIFSKKTLLNVKTTGAIQAELSGDIALATEKNPFNLNLNSPSASYAITLDKNDPLKLNNVALNLQGDMSHYQLTLSGNAKGMNIPATSVNLKGNGTITHFAIDNLNLTALDGKAQLSGLVDWRDGVEWQSKLKLNNINTKSLAPDWAAVLSGDLENNGYAARGKESGEWAVHVPKIDIKRHAFTTLVSTSRAIEVRSSNLVERTKCNLDLWRKSHRNARRVG